MHAHRTTIDTIAKECIALRVRMLSRIVTGIYDTALRPLGLKAAQFNLLIAAAKLGLASPAKVCQILHLDASTLSRNLDRLRAGGWLETVEGDDARRQPFRLTPAGKRLLGRAIPAWDRAQARVRHLLGDEAVARLMAATARAATPTAPATSVGGRTRRQAPSP